MALEPDNNEQVNDLGHRGNVDRTQIEAMLRLTPLERIRKHEGWRIFAKKALEYQYAKSCKP